MRASSGSAAVRSRSPPCRGSTAPTASATTPGTTHYLVDHSTYIYVMDPGGEFVIGLDWDAPGDEIADVMHGFISGDSQ